jgi:hypothetical protein
MTWLRGKRTYLVAIVIGLVAVARHLGWIDAATAEMIETVLIGGGLAALRAGLAPEGRR